MSNATTNPAPMYLNAVQMRVLGDLQKVRRMAGGFNHEVHVEFLLASSDGWERHGFAGIKAACWVLRAEIVNMPGAYNLYEAAGKLMSACDAA